MFPPHNDEKIDKIDLDEAESQLDKILPILCAEMGASKAAKLAAKITGIDKKYCYKNIRLHSTKLSSRFFGRGRSAIDRGLSRPSLRARSRPFFRRRCVRKRMTFRPKTVPDRDRAEKNNFRHLLADSGAILASF